MKKASPKQYQKVMITLTKCKDKKNQQLSRKMKQELYDFVESAERVKSLDWEKGHLMLTEREFIQHWKLREGISKEKAARKWTKNLNAKDAFTKKNKQGKLTLAVEKPEECKEIDSVRRKRKIGGDHAHDKDTMMALAKGWGGGSAQKMLKGIADGKGNADDEERPAKRRKKAVVVSESESSAADDSDDDDDSSDDNDGSDEESDSAASDDDDAEAKKGPRKEESNDDEEEDGEGDSDEDETSEDPPPKKKKEGKKKDIDVPGVPIFLDA